MSEIRPIRPSPEDRQAIRREMRELHDAPPLSPEQAHEIVLHLANGTRITHLPEIGNMPPYAVINAWRRMHPWFDEACVAASEAWADRALYETIEIADDVSRAPACREVSIRARQYAQKVLHRKRFDPAVKVELSQGAVNADELSDADLARIVGERERAQARALGQGVPGSPPHADPGDRIREIGRAHV